MSVIALDRLLRKIEAARRPAGGLFYLLWGRSLDVIEDTLAAAMKAGTLSAGDQIVKAVWPCVNGMSSSRWAISEVGEFLHAEFGALAELVDDFRDEFCERVFGKVRQAPPEPDPQDDTPDWFKPSPPRRKRPDYMGQTTDAAWS